MTAFYDLRTQPASFDFWVWCAIAKGSGADTVCFDRDTGFKYQDEPQDLQRRMFVNVVLPTARIFGLEVEFGRETGDMKRFPHTNRHAKGKLFLPTIELPEGMSPIGSPTVTIRNSHKHQERNSGEQWREFAKEIGAWVIEDALDEPLPLATRMEIYATSSQNYFMVGGPGTAALWTTNVSTLMWMPPGRLQRNISPNHGHQYPWANARQQFVWEEPTLESLLDWHGHLFG